jgi:hypothetical protein
MAVVEGYPSITLGGEETKLLMKMTLMRYLLITISHGLMTEKCLNALNVILTKSLT